MILGTAAYMSPEQARGGQVDKRTDIWAFGAVLFEMLTGRRPFSGGSLADVLAAVVGRDPDWTVCPPLPHDVCAISCAGACRRIRRDASAISAMRGSNSEDAAAEPADPSVPVDATPRGRSATVAWTVAALSLATAAIALFLYWRPVATETRPGMRFSVVTNFAGVEGQPSLSPDGRSVAFVSNRDGQWDVYVGLVTGGGLVRLTSDANVEAQPRWSPDGTRLLFSRLNELGGQDIWVTPAFPGTARRLISNAYSPAWSPDGRRIAYSTANVIWMCDADGANARQLTRTEPAPMFHYQPVFSHGGQSLAFIRRRLGPRSELALVDLATGNIRNLTADDALALSPAWAPDDRFLYFSSSRGGTMNIWRLTVATSAATQITAGQGDDLEIDVSADGARIVFSSYRANTNLAEISLDPASSGRRTWLTKDLARSETAPRYSPDGTRIAYFTNRSGAEREGIWVMNADGSNATQLVEDGQRTNIYPRWSSDGNDLFFYSRLGGSMSANADLRRVALAGGAPHVLPIRPWFPFWGWGDVDRDGRFLYRTTETSGELFDSRTNRREPVPNLAGDPLWSDDGGSFAYATRAGEGASVTPGLWVATPGAPPGGCSKAGSSGSRGATAATCSSWKAGPTSRRSSGACRRAASGRSR